MFSSLDSSNFKGRKGKLVRSAKQIVCVFTGLEANNNINSMLEFGQEVFAVDLMVIAQYIVRLPVWRKVFLWPYPIHDTAKADKVEIYCYPGCINIFPFIYFLTCSLSQKTKML